MPIKLPTTFGKTDYTVVTALRSLEQAVQVLEQRPAPRDWTAEIANLRNQVATLTQRVDVLAQQVQTLQNP